MCVTSWFESGDSDWGDLNSFSEKLHVWSGLPHSLVGIVSLDNNVVRNTARECTLLFDEPDHWLHHYRIIQEILNNALKHSNAKNVWIHASLDDKYFFLSITDDGIGFDKDAVALAATGSGLRNIFNRVALLRGQVIIDTLPQQGVRYQIKTPLNYAK